MARILYGTVGVWLMAMGVAAAQGEAPADAAAPAVEAPAAAPAEQPAAPAPSPEAVAAKEAFDALHVQWGEVVKQIEAVETERKAAAGDARKTLDAKALQLHKDAEALIDKIVVAGVAVFKLSPDAYPEINATLLAVAEFHLIGDARADGGDQYEKALALIKPLIDAGGGDKWPQLYLWGGIAAYATNDFDLADEYFKKSRANGGDAAGSSRALAQLAQQFREGLPAIRQAWTKENELRDAEAKADDLPRVKFTTNDGEIIIELFENEAPQAVANFITLVKQGFYDGVVFHRVLPQFMAQGGDPTGTGGGGPGYSIPCECHKSDYRHHFRGSLSMAHAGRDTGGSQFFLTFVPTSFLDGKHTVFGRVVEGMDVAASIKRRNPDAPVGQPDKIIKAEVLRDRGHEYKFDKLPGR